MFETFIIYASYFCISLVVIVAVSLGWKWLKEYFGGNNG